MAITNMYERSNVRAFLNFYLILLAYVSAMTEYDMFISEIANLRSEGTNALCHECAQPLFLDSEANISDAKMSLRTFIPHSSYNIPCYHLNCLLDSSGNISDIILKTFQEILPLLEDYAMYYFIEIFERLPMDGFDEKFARFANAISKIYDNESQPEMSLGSIYPECGLEKLIELKKKLCDSGISSDNVLIAWLSSDIVGEFENHYINFPEDDIYYNYIDLKLYNDMPFEYFYKIIKIFQWKTSNEFFKEYMYRALVECPDLTISQDALQIWDILNETYSNLKLNLSYYHFEVLIKGALNNADITLALVLCFQMKAFKIEYSSHFLIAIIETLLVRKNFRYSDLFRILSIFQFKKKFDDIDIQYIVNLITAIDHKDSGSKALQQEILRLLPNILKTPVHNNIEAVMRSLYAEQNFPTSSDNSRHSTSNLNELTEMRLFEIFYYSNTSVCLQQILFAFQAFSEVYNTDLWNFISLYVLFPESGKITENGTALSVTQHIDNLYFMKKLRCIKDENKLSGVFFMFFIMQRDYFGFDDWINHIQKLSFLEDDLSYFLLLGINKTNFYERYTTRDHTNRLFDILVKNSCICNIHIHWNYLKNAEGASTFFEKIYSPENIQACEVSDDIFQNALCNLSAYPSIVLLCRENRVYYIFSCLQSEITSILKRENILGMLMDYLKNNADSYNLFIGDIYNEIANADISDEGKIIMFTNYFRMVMHDKSRNIMAYHIYSMKIGEHQAKNNRLRGLKMFERNIQSNFEVWKTMRFPRDEYHWLIHVAFN